MLAELLHGQVALCLAEVAVQGLGIVAVLDEFVGHFLCLQTGAAEDDGVDFRVIVHHAFQGQILVAGPHQIILVVYELGAFVARAHHDFLVVAQVVLGYLLYFLAHGGREEQGVAFLRHAFQYLVNAFGETHVEHLVGLVEHHVLHQVEPCRLAPHQVNEPARRGHDDLRPAFQGAYLALDIGSAIDGHHAETLDIA